MRFDLKKNTGQSIFEYFILTIVVVSVALFFMKTKAYQNINSTTGTAFNQAVDKITANSEDSGESSSPAESVSSAQEQVVDADLVDQANEKAADTMENIAEQLDIEGFKDAVNGNSGAAK